MNQVIKKRIEDINNGIVPKGYKKTPFGIFPRDWETDKKHGDLFEFNSSLSKSREELGEKGYAYLHYGDMHRHSFNTVSYEEYMCLPKADVSLSGKEKYLMKDGDVAFLDASEDLEGTSRCVLIDNPGNEPFFAGLHTIPAREKEDDFSKWYKQYITLPDFVKKQFQRLACGFKVYGLNKETIAKINTAFPKDKEEQSKIAEILMKWDEMVELQEQYIQKLELRKKAIMKKLLTPKDGWENVRMSELGDLYQPQTISDSQLKETGYLVYGANGIIGFYDKYNHENSEIAITCRGSTCGTVTFTAPKSWITGNAMVFKVNNQYSKKFLLYVCVLRGFKDIVSGSGQPQITRQAFNKVFLNVPSTIEEQQKISTVLEQVDEEIFLQKEKLAKIKENALQCKAFSFTVILRYAQ